MTAVCSVLYLAGCLVVAVALGYRRFGVNNDGDWVSALLTLFTVFFSLFFGGFYILAYLNLATTLPVVNPEYAALLASVAFGGFWLRLKSKWAGQGATLSSSFFALQKTGSQISGWTRFTVVAALVVFGLIGLMLMSGFPRGYEAQGYHLPIGLHVFQSQSLQLWDTVYFHAFPWNASIYYGFLLAFLSEHLVAAGNLLFLIPLITAVFALARATGADVSASWLAAFGLLSIPLIAYGTFALATDVSALAFLAMALYFALVGSSRHLVGPLLCGLAAGLAFGFKSLHLISIAFIFLLLLFQLLSQFRSSTTRRSWTTEVAGPLLAFLVAVWAMSSFWLVRNYVQMGNPLYPVYFPVMSLLGWQPPWDLDIQGRISVTQFEWVRSTLEWFVYPWVEWSFNGQNFKGSSGLGAFFAATVPVASFAALTGLIREGGQRRLTLLSLLGGGAFVLAAWWIIGDRQPRYAMAALVYLIPPVAWTLSRTTGTSRKAFEGIVAVCILSMLLIFFTTELVEFGGRFVYGKQFTRASYYRYPAMIDQLPPGSTIVNLGHRTWNYSLFGKNHQNRIVNYMQALYALRFQSAGSDQPAESAHLSSVVLRELGATHLFTEGFPTLTTDDTIRLKEVDTLDKDQFGNPLTRRLKLYEIQYP